MQPASRAQLCGRVAPNRTTRLFHGVITSTDHSSTAAFKFKRGHHVPACAVCHYWAVYETAASLQPSSLQSWLRSADLETRHKEDAGVGIRVTRSIQPAWRT